MSEVLLERQSAVQETPEGPDQLDIEALNAEFEQLTPFERIATTRDLFGGRLVLSTTFGPTAPVLLKTVTDIIPDIPVVNIRHGYETQTTLDHAGIYWQRLGLNLKHYRSLKLPIPEDDTPQFDRFQRKTKVEPFQHMLDDLQPAAYFSGSMRWQTPGRANLPFVQDKGAVLAINPLADLKPEDVDEFFAQSGLPKNEDYFDPAKGEDQTRECQLNTTIYEGALS